MKVRFSSIIPTSGKERVLHLVHDRGTHIQGTVLISFRPQPDGELFTFRNIKDTIPIALVSRRVLAVKEEKYASV